MKARAKNIITICTGTALLLFLSLCDLCCGDISIGEMFQGRMAADIMLGIRLPRLFTAILAGSSLAIAGAQMQALFRNPLADPHIMGVSAGAGTGAAIATIALAGSAVSLSGLTIAASAFMGAILASALVILVSSKVRNGNTLLLFGVMLGFIFSAVTSMIEYSASEESLRIFYSWSAGSFSGNRYSEIWIFAALLSAGFILSLLNGKGLDISLFGDGWSEVSGAPVRRIRLVSMISCCLVTGAATAFCGPIGFAGIIAPHIARWAMGTSVHRTILPASALTGAITAVLADILATLPERPVPAGSTMALIGIPVILYILLDKSKI